MTRFLRLGLPFLVASLFAVAPGHAGNSKAWETAVAAFQSGDYVAAQGHFEKVVREQPDWVGGHLMLGRTLLKLDRAEEALAPLRRALRLDADSAQTQMVLGQALIENKAYREAGEVLAKVSERSLTGEQRATLDLLRRAARAGVMQSRVGPPTAALVSDGCAGDHFGRWVLKAFCLGGLPEEGLSGVPRDEGGAGYVKDGVIAFANENGVIWRIAKKLEPPTWITIRDVQRGLEAVYGPARSDFSDFPDYADSESTRETAIGLGKGRFWLNWSNEEAAVDLQWDHKGARLLYTARAAEPAHDNPKGY